MRTLVLMSLAAALVLVMAPSHSPVLGAEIRSGDKVEIKADETIADDLYVFGRQITIDGTVEGDVIAFGEQITVNGTVKGHVMAAGHTVVLTGDSEGARIAGQVLRLGPKAKLDGDILAAGLSLECAKDSSISGDALYAGYQALFGGHIGADLRGGMSNCRLEGTIGGDVKVEAGGEKNAPPATSFGPPPPVAMPNVPGGLTLADSAVVEGDLTYQSPQEAKIDPQAKVNGEIEHVAPQPKAKGAKAAPAQGGAVAKILTQLRHLACVAIVGLAVLLIFPQWSTAWADTIRTRPGASFLGGIAGLAAFIALLVVLAIFIVLAAIMLGVATLGELVPMVIVGGVVGYAALIVGFWLLAAFLAEALAGLAIGRLALPSESIGTRLGALLVGILLVGVLLSIPYVGGLVGLAVMIVGIGSICLWLIGQAPPQSFASLPPEKPLAASVM
jgi:cytoskeletal protein CcmA (bactofilin family)